MSRKFITAMLWYSAICSFCSLMNRYSFILLFFVFFVFFYSLVSVVSISVYQIRSHGIGYLGTVAEDTYPRCRALELNREPYAW